MQPTTNAADAPPSAVVATVQKQSVGRVLNLNVTVSQSTRPLAVNVRSGVVTSVAGRGTTKQGDVLYRVGNHPVVAIMGTMPFYRTLTTGDKGTDVAQLRRALVAQKLLRSPGKKFDGATYSALRAWQKRLGVESTGRLELGDAVAIAKLPAGLSLDRKLLRKGLVLNGGEKVVSGRVGQPSFALVVGQEQAKLIPSSATLTMTYKGAAWKAVIADSTVTANGETQLALTAPGGGAVCGKKCGLVSGDKDLYVPAEVQIVPPVSGPAVPVAAVTTNADGTASVTIIGDDGRSLPRTVTVKGSQDGVAVVDGVTVGERVQVLAAPEPSASPNR